MFLSRIVVDWHWAKEPYQLHRALWQLFPERPKTKRDFLFRIEGQSGPDGLQLLLQSALAPQSVKVARVVMSKPLQMMLSEGLRLHFRLRANPVKSIKDAGGRLNVNGRIKNCRVPLTGKKDLQQWLVRKLGMSALLQECGSTIEPVLLFQKKGITGKIQPVMYEGTLVICAVDEFISLIYNGIGPAKSMGCGLLSLARAGEQKKAA
ncbi:type I-E CRISPR-associated protein Cas6/Cse3/CasE [Enterobacteriaceae bacterium LUAb1]